MAPEPGRSPAILEELRMTAIYEAADQRVIEQDGLVLLEVDVDADEPTDPDWHIRLLAPVKADAGQAFAHRVNWRGRVSHP